jgi:uncharacterized protein (DUF1697 family)
MSRYVALLRGINVGGHRVKMDRLRGMFQDMGFTDVSTYIASGNVVFGTDSSDEVALRNTVERHLNESLGYEVATFLRTPAELAAVSRAAFDDRGSAPPYASHYVIFLHAPAPASLRSGLVDLSSDVDAFDFVGREVHWRMRGKMSESPLFAGPLDRAIRGIPNTARNMNTVRRIVAKASLG